ncbi:MAG: ACP S-malonyltransferase [Clostridiales Family XIII bacterium]|jgi:[acyl-carrier-protein] S-malonyltransferase|nr:ACP S-malonyltransferase [Clostridiales Family XIII bacterium]
MKAGLLFAGQGAQYEGMGKSLYDAYPAARGIFDRAGDEIKRLCFAGTRADLRQTHITQPTVFTVDVAAYAALREGLAREGLAEADGGGLAIAGLAGFSLGEYAALTAAGCIADFESALALVEKRGAYMAEAGRDAAGEQKGAMLAVFGERQAVLEAVASARAGDILEAVNFNAPTQTVAAGDLAAIDRLRKRVKETDGLKAVPLNVSAAFHSPMMEPASERLAEAVRDMDFSAPRVRVYANTTGRDLTEGKPAALSDAAWIRARLALQLKSPVYWQETIENMAADGIELFIELGPGQTLTGLVKKISPKARTLNVAEAEGLESALSSIKEEIGCAR